ncbi:septation protein A [Pelagibius litoralis]|uniref:Inner membrane-spanning protein YciB n=1 Tax=Pelagibius litoralis TaxID=374515 RepID=A0A967EX75_9PROT|nr:septation protein A [Pelagibius litoralis]NIA68090.1 septation protein A [Pelagibius litoralis]
MKAPAPAWLRPAVDYGPLAAFFAVYWLNGLMAATLAIMIATAAALALSFVIERRIPPMPLLTAMVVGVFGGLTLWLEDETFFKMKPTIVQVLFAAVLFGGLFFKRPLLKPLLASAWPLDDAGWIKLSSRFAWFFVAMAVLNEVVWRTQSTDFWVTFKVFGILGLTFIFVASQVYFMRAHMAPVEEDLGG